MLIPMLHYKLDNLQSITIYGGNTFVIKYN